MGEWSCWRDLFTLSSNFKNRKRLPGNIPPPLPLAISTCQRTVFPTRNAAVAPAVDPTESAANPTARPKTYPPPSCSPLPSPPACVGTSPHWSSKKLGTVFLDEGLWEITSYLMSNSGVFDAWGCCSSFWGSDHVVEIWNKKSDIHITLIWRSHTKQFPSASFFIVSHRFCQLLLFRFNPFFFLSLQVSQYICIICIIIHMLLCI